MAVARRPSARQIGLDFELVHCRARLAMSLAPRARCHPPEDASALSVLGTRAVPKDTICARVAVRPADLVASEAGGAASSSVTQGVMRADCVDELMRKEKSSAPPPAWPPCRRSDPGRHMMTGTYSLSARAFDPGTTPKPRSRPSPAS